MLASCSRAPWSASNSGVFWYSRRFAEQASKYTSSCTFLASLKRLSFAGELQRRLPIYPSGHNYLINTDAEVSVLPVSRPIKLFPQQLELAAANCTPITNYDYRKVDVTLGLCRTFSLCFILADISFPLLCADFLCHYGLLVDMLPRTLIGLTTSLRSSGKISSCTNDTFSITFEDVVTHAKVPQYHY